MKARLSTLLGTLLVAASLLAGLGGGTASAAFPGVNGKLVFWGARTSEGPWGLWVGNADGSGTMRPVAIGTTVDGIGDPAWSPDGTEIAFSRWAHQQGIWVMNADGSGKRRLTSAADRAPTWSPDGTRIAFERGRWGAAGTVRPQIYVMNADGSGQARLTDNQWGDQSPAWSPDDSKIAFTHGGIWVMNPDGSNQRNLHPFDDFCGGWGPEWSPDGSKIAFARSCDTVHCDGTCSEIAVMNADGSNDTDLTDFAFDSGPAWSPDGAKIAFAHCDYDPDHIYCPKYRTHVWVMNPDGTDKRNVTSRFYWAEQVDWQPLPLAAPSDRGR